MRCILKIIIVSLMWVLMTTPSFLHAYNGGLTSSVDLSRPVPSKQIIHTVQKSETIWEIARFFGVDISQVARVNQLENPDLIFPGDKLVIQIQEDFSIRVTQGEPTTPTVVSQTENSDPLHVQVIYPSREDIFAPENPLVVYDQKESSLSREQTRSNGNPKVFQGFVEFVQWLFGESRSTRQTQATGFPDIDPIPSSPYFISQGLSSAFSFEDSTRILVPEDAFPQFHSDPASPPPKSL